MPHIMIHRVTIVALALALAALVAFTYAGVADLDLVYDDHRLVEQNPGLDGSWGSLWTSDLSGPGRWRIYRPLVAASWKLERGNVPLHHIVNVMWHVVAVWGVFGLAIVFGPGTRRARFAAAAVAALFALHPLATEPVCWVSRRADVMAGALTLWSILAGAISVKTSRWWAPVAVLLAIGAMLSKEIGVIAPVMWIVVALALRGSLVRWIVAATVLVAGFASLRFALFGSVSGQPVAFVQNWVFDAPDAHPIATALNLITLAGSLIAFPNRLSADYSWHSVDPATWPPFGATFGALILLAMLALIAYRRNHPAVVVGLACALVAYVPVSNLIVPVGAAFAERFLYLPLAGLALAFSSLFVRARSFEIAIVVAIALVGGWASRERVPDWTNDDTLFASVLDVYPANVVAHTYQAIARREAGDLAGASIHYTAALDVYPDYHLARVNRAFILLETGRIEAAIAEAGWIIEREPEPGAPHLVTGIGNIELGNDEEGEAALWRAAADPAIRRDALAELFNFYRARGDVAGLTRVRDMAMDGAR
jgi:hypothetical protein